MVRYIIKSTNPARSDHDELVASLVDELKAGTKNQPAFIERFMRATDSREIYVIWDGWADVPEVERGDIALEAYRRYDEESSSNIAFAIGLTAQEALETGLLPFLVRPSASRGHQETAFIDVEQAKKRELANTILGARGSELRYPTAEAAEQAIERLQHDLPNSRWIITEEAPR